MHKMERKKLRVLRRRVEVKESSGGVIPLDKNDNQFYLIEFINIFGNFNFSPTKVINDIFSDSFSVVQLR